MTAFNIMLRKYKDLLVAEEENALLRSQLVSKQTPEDQAIEEAYAILRSELDNTKKERNRLIIALKFVRPIKLAYSSLAPNKRL